MEKSLLQPYLALNGTCEEAMKFYQSVLGGELEFSRFGDFASEERPVSDEQKDKIMHAVLRNDTLTFMASDGMPGKALQSGENVSLSISGNNKEELTKYFNGLSEGGEVTLPLAKQMWGDEFGMFTDKYGFHWMINIAAEKPANS